MERQWLPNELEEEKKPATEVIEGIGLKCFLLQ